MKYKFRTTPMKHQYKALKFLVENKGVGALLMDPGTGKTKVVIDYLGILTAKRGFAKALVAAPLSALDTWASELEKHIGSVEYSDGKGHELPARAFVLNDGSILDKYQFIKDLDDDYDGLTIIVINHDAFKYRHKVPGLKTVTVRDRMIEAVKDWAPDVVVVDEMHRLKTHSSNLSTAFHKIGRSSFQRIGLTGTVAPHSPLDFFGQWRFINPQTFGERWQNFRYYYAIYGGYEGRQVIGFHTDRLKEMKKKVRKDAVIVKKHEALDLPKVTDILVPVHLSSEIPYYKAMGKELIVELPSGKESISRNTLTKMLRLRQITGGVVGYKEYMFNDDGSPVLDREGIPKEVSKTEDIGNSKLKVLMDKVEDIIEAGEKQVIFAHFRRDVQRILEECQKNNLVKRLSLPVYSITGDVKGTTRHERRRAFYEDTIPSIFVAQMRTVSLAVNEFVVASYGHFYSYSQLRDDFIQARDRLDRQGQKSPVTFYHYVVPHSIDAVILDTHREKGQLEAAITKRGKEILTLGEET